MNDTPHLLAAAAESAGAQSHPAGALYVVATPIGNRADITLRAVHVLHLADAVACEDTRNSGQWLHSMGLHKPLLAVHEHNEREASERVIERLQQGQRVVYISDAGTPAISDPGAALVQAVQAAGLRCIPIPGCSSALAALSVAGDANAQGFHFTGFLPAKGRLRSSALAALARSPHCTVLFESPHRITALADELAQHLGPRLLTVGRELTKQFEAVHTLPALELAAWLMGDPHRVRGEFVIVVHSSSPGGEGARDDQGAADRLSETSMHTLRVLLAELPLKQAAALASQITGEPRKRLYQAALELQKPEGQPLNADTPGASGTPDTPDTHD